MVAILGRIMPAPLLMPVRVMVALPSATRLETIFGRVSVVMMLWAAANQLSARSEEHTSELQSLMRNSYAVFCLKKKTVNITDTRTDNSNIRLVQNQLTTTE